MRFSPILCANRLQQKNLIYIYNTYIGFFVELFPTQFYIPPLIFTHTFSFPFHIYIPIYCEGNARSKAGAQALRQIKYFFSFSSSLVSVAHASRNIPPTI